MNGSLWSAAAHVSVPDRWLERLRQRPILVDAPVRPRRTSHAALLLGVFFLSLYVLTMGGHLDSPDEELMFQVTRSLAERGSMDTGDANLAERLAMPGTDGRTYAPYGPVASIISVPFYDFGRLLAAGLPPRYSEVIARFAVGLRDPVMTAGACVLFFWLGREIGYGTRPAVLLTLAFGLATMVWPFSKYSFSEPVTGFWLLLAVLAAMRTARSADLKWSVLVGIAVGMAIGSKVTAVLAVPGLLAYLVVATPGRLVTRARSALPFLVVLGIPAAALAFNNITRFGNPFDTGYHLDNLVDLSHPIGIAGLLFSPSKSVFVYAPVALLGVAGMVRLASRLPWEAALFAWLFVSHVVFHGFLVIWAGDAAWGPRYLVPVLAFVVLPAGALLAWTPGTSRRWSGGAFGVLFAIGVVVNLGGVLVDQRVSFVSLFQTAGGDLARMDDQRWDPGQSAALIHWQEIFKRYSNLVRLWSQPVSLQSGTYGKEAVEPVDVEEAARSPLFPRWTSGAATFELKNHSQPAQFSLVYLDNRPEELGPAVVQIAVDGSLLPEADIVRTHASVPLPDRRFPWIVDARLDDAVVGHDRVTVEIRSQTWQPARDAPPSVDVRDLGVQIWDLHFNSNGQELAIGEPLFSPMPVSDARPWSTELENWFYTPPWHVADVWLWYLYLSGLPHWLMVIAVLPAAGLVWSGLLLRRLIRCAPCPAAAGQR